MHWDIDKPSLFKIPAKKRVWRKEASFSVLTWLLAHYSQHFCFIRSTPSWGRRLKYDITTWTSSTLVAWLAPTVLGPLLRIWWKSLFMDLVLLPCISLSLGIWVLQSRTRCFCVKCGGLCNAHKILFVTQHGEFNALAFRLSSDDVHQTFVWNSSVAVHFIRQGIRLSPFEWPKKKRM